MGGRKFLIGLYAIVFFVGLYCTPRSTSATDIPNMMSEKVDPDFFHLMYEVVEVRVVKMTAYTSLRGCTDNTPYITASQLRVRRGIVAMNGVPFGTLVLYENQVFEVQDRKHRRYDGSWVDVYVPTKKEAKKFGIKKNQTVALVLRKPVFDIARTRPHAVIDGAA